MPRPILATVDRAAIRHNIQHLRERSGARVWAVLKANAYGHGIERAYEGLRAADGFALLDLDEAQRVRDLGWRGPVLLLEGVFEPRDLELVSRLGLWHTVHCDEQIEMLAAHKTDQPQRVFLKLNSGMNRLGFAPHRYRSAYARLDALAQVDDITHMTHFSDSDGPRGIAHQMATFETAVEGLPGERSVSNSGATLRHAQAPAVRGDWVRPGIAVYGSSPDFPEHSAAHWGLLPTLTLSCEVLAVQSLQPGDTVGYGSTYTAQVAHRIGIVACGYADGYPRHAPGANPTADAPRTPVVVAGVRTHTVGRVSMDMICVDLSPLDAQGVAVGPGSAVVMFGASDAGSLPIDEVAHAAGTVSYELMCALAARVPTVAVG